MNTEIIINTLKWLVLITGMLDSWKYRFIAQKVSRLKSSREVSRKFINVSIIYRIFLFIYSVWILKDWVLIWSCIIALYTSCDAFYTVYLYYPYKKRGLKNFKRPSLMKYIINSLLPNRFAKKL